MLVGVVYVGAHRAMKSSSPPVTVIPGTIQPWKVEVVNTIGEAGLGQRVTEYLRRRGFDVVDVRSARGEGTGKSRVLDRTGRPKAAEEVAAALGFPPDRVTSQPDRTLLLDVSVIVGSDYTTFTSLATGIR